MNLNIKQQQAIAKLSKLKAGALFMKMGTGKTRVAIELAKLKQNDFDYIVWIAPASLIFSSNYKEEIAKWTDGLIREIKFYTIESVGSSDTKYIDLYNTIDKFKTFCIVDESITIKNTESKRTIRLLKIWNKFTFRLILNGTLLTQGLIDLYSQIQFIHPAILNMSETEFANKFLTYRKDGEKSWKRWSISANEEALVEMIRPYIFDCETENLLKKNFCNINCFLNNYEVNNYIREKEKFFSKLQISGKQIDFLSVIQKLQHIYTINCKEKFIKLVELINNIKKRGEKTLVFCKYLDEVEFIKQHISCSVLTGFEGKKNAINDFKNKEDVLLLTYGVGSFGLNLQFANNIIFFSQTFDYKHKEQAIYRIYRTGQEKNCYIYNLYVNTNLENIIRTSLEKKENTLKNVENFIKKNGVENL